MRQPRVGFTSWKLLIPFLIGADLFALWAWTVRPSRIYRDWLGWANLATNLHGSVWLVGPIGRAGP